MRAKSKMKNRQKSLTDANIKIQSIEKLEKKLPLATYVE